MRLLFLICLLLLHLVVCQYYHVDNPNITNIYEGPHSPLGTNPYNICDDIVECQRYWFQKLWQKILKKSSEKYKKTKKYLHEKFIESDERYQQTKEIKTGETPWNDLHAVYS